MSRVSHSHLEMDDVEIKFKAKIGDMVSNTVTGNEFNGVSSLSCSDMQMQMEGIKANDGDVMEVTIHFKAKDTPEGARA